MWTDINLKVVKSIFHPLQLHSHFKLTKEVVEYFSKKLNNMKEKYQKYWQHEFYTNNYEAEQVQLDWNK